MRIVSRTGICKTPSGTHYLDVGGSVNFDATVNVRGNLLMDSTATIEAAAAAGGDVTIGATATTTIINIGSAAHAKTINIGGPLDTVVIDGNVLTNNTTNLTVEDKLITLNKGGAAASAFESGMEFEENNVITGFVRTSAARDGIQIKGPARAGTIILRPHTAAAALTIDSLATVARTWTFPDVSDIVVGEAASQTLTNKTLTSATIGGTTNISGTVSNAATSTHSGTSTFSGTVNLTSTVSVTGNISGRGIVPVGAVVALFALPGGFSAPASGSVSNGWMRSDGAAVPASQVITAGTLTPNLSNDRFIMGATTSGTLGGNNSVSTSVPAAGLTFSTTSGATVATTNFNSATINVSVPGHRHNFSSSNATVDISHTHADSDVFGNTNTTGNHQHVPNLTNSYYGLYDGNSTNASGTDSGAAGSEINLNVRGGSLTSSNGDHSHDSGSYTAAGQTLGATSKAVSGFVGTAATNGDAAFNATFNANSLNAHDNNPSHTHSVSGSVAGSATATAWNNRPLYISAIYIIRVS